MEPSDDAATVVELYVEAVADGDFESAMDLQCSAARIPEESRELWLSQLERFQDDEGDVTHATTKRIRGTGLQPAADLPDLVEVSYGLAIDGEVRDSLLAATVIENGNRRMCGRGTTAARELFADFSEPPPSGPETVVAPKDLLPVEPPDGYRQIEDKATEPLGDSQPGELEGWTRAWQQGEYGGVRATVLRFDTAENAREAVAYYLSKKASDSVASIVYPDQPYARGTRLLGFAWLGIQPPDLGPYVDYVYAAFGRTMVVVAAADLPTGSDHSLSGSFLEAIADSVTP